MIVACIRYNGFYFKFFFACLTNFIPHLGLLIITIQTCHSFKNQVQKFISTISETKLMEISLLNFAHESIDSGLEIAKGFDIDNSFLLMTISFILSNFIVLIQYEISLDYFRYDEIFTQEYNITSNITFSDWSKNKTVKSLNFVINFNP